MGKPITVWASDEAEEMLNEMAKSEQRSKSNLFNKLVRKEYNIFKEKKK